MISRRELFRGFAGIAVVGSVGGVYAVDNVIRKSKFQHVGDLIRKSHAAHISNSPLFHANNDELIGFLHDKFDIYNPHEGNFVIGAIRTCLATLELPFQPAKLTKWGILSDKYEELILSGLGYDKDGRFNNIPSPSKYGYVIDWGIGGEMDKIRRSYFPEYFVEAA